MNEDDKVLLVKFEKRSVKNNFQSKEKNIPVYDNIDFIRIIVPGHAVQEVIRKVTPEDKVRFSEYWAKYEKNEEIKLDGTLIEMLPGIAGHEIEGCKAINVLTIEQLSKLSQKAIDNLTKAIGLGSQELVTRAKKYLTGGSDTKGIEKKLEEALDKIKSLEKQLEAKDDTLDDGAEHSGRDTTGGKTDNSGRVGGQVRKASAGGNKQARKRTANA